MDLQGMFNIGVTIITGGVGWFANNMYRAVDALKTDLYKFREQVAVTYMTKQDIQAMREEILGALRRIEDKIDKS